MRWFWEIAVDVRPRRLQGNEWRTSLAKLLDNAVVAFVIENGIERLGPRTERGARGAVLGQDDERTPDDPGRLYRSSSVPTLSTFYGIVIQMFWRDHSPPHFHALYAEHEVLVDLRDFSVVRGSLPGRAMGLVLECATQHREELMEDWTLCSQLRHPRPIEPLR